MEVDEQELQPGLLRRENQQMCLVATWVVQGVGFSARHQGECPWSQAARAPAALGFDEYEAAQNEDRFVFVRVGMSCSAVAAWGDGSATGNPPGWWIGGKPRSQLQRNL